MQDKLLEALKKYWGFSSLRPGQEAILKSVLEGRDTIAVLPTGGGKSLCYQLPAVITGRISIVVSPLLALMRDQAHHLTEVGVKSCCLNSELNQIQLMHCLNEIQTYQVVYATPEYLLNHPTFLADLRARNILGLFAIDEAHCASSWGHDFRPSYLRLSEVRRTLTDIPVLALTATAPPSIIKDLINILGLHNCNCIIGDLTRDNLFIRVTKKLSNKDPLSDLCKVLDGSNTIIYTLKREETDIIYTSLTKAGYKSVEKYHAELPAAEKAEIYRKFISNEVTILIATIAFGMGIDKSDIRTIINWGLPPNLETYYQEIGRAGRDGKRANCYLFWSESDIITAKYHVSKNQSTKLASEQLRKINVMDLYVRSPKCRRALINEYFRSETADLSSMISVASHKDGTFCGMCDNCSAAKVRQDESFLSKSMNTPGVSEASGHTIPSTTLAPDDGDRANTEDFGKQAKLIFGLMRGLSFNYGSTMVIAILRGSRNARITGTTMALPEYGAGTSWSEKWWKAFIKTLIGNGFLSKIAKRAEAKMIEILSLNQKSNNWLNSGNNELLLEPDLELSALNPKKARVECLLPKLRPLTAPTGNSNTADTSSSDIDTTATGVGVASDTLTPTLSETYTMIKNKKTVQEISTTRGYNERTIEGHIIKIAEIEGETFKQYLPDLGISNDRLKLLLTEIPRIESALSGKCRLRDLKAAAPADWTYFEINLALVYIRHAQRRTS